MALKARAWLVDLDGTLYHSLPIKLIMAGELLLCGHNAIGPLRNFRRAHEELRWEVEQRVGSPLRVQLEMAAEWSEIPPDQLEMLVLEWMIWRPCKWLRAFARRPFLGEIAAFRRQGGVTALVSDYPAHAKLQALGARCLFDVVVANGEDLCPPRLKPWPDGYLMAAKQLGVPPKECLVLGDREDADGDAARKAGMAFRRVG